MIKFLCILSMLNLSCHFLPNSKIDKQKVFVTDYFLKQHFGANFFNEKDELKRFIAAKELGLDIIRLTPSKWASFRPGAKKGEFLIGDQKEYKGLYKKDLEELIRILDMANGTGLKVILTFLNIPGLMWRQHNNNKPDCRIWNDFKFHKQAAQFMADIAEAVSKHPAVVALNPINEPAPEHCFSFPVDWADSSAYKKWQEDIIKTPADLNLLYKLMHENIRKYNQDIPIIFDSSFYATPHALPFLIPFEDKHVLYSIHMYEPFIYTFQRKPGLLYPGIIPFGEKTKNSQYWDKIALKNFFEPILSWQKQNSISNNRIIVGEFGIDRLAKGAINYFTDLIDIFNEYGWTWIFYSFREYNFTKMDYEMGQERPGWHYWQAMEKNQSPDYSRYKKSEFIEVIKKSIAKQRSIDF